MGCSYCKTGDVDKKHEETNTVVHEIQENLTPDPPPISEPELRPVTTPEKEECKTNSIILQGELFKLQPGTKNRPIVRWMQLYQQDLRYYKNEYSAAFWWDKPLGVIPIENIEGLSSDINETPLQFEVLMKKISASNNNGKSERSVRASPGSPIKNQDNSRYIFNAKTREDANMWKKAILDLINKGN